ncbi:methyltransferase [Acerihabitans sp. TG2]|nr:methyltransferase [Acerihabitans sp. TG2]MEA9392422.1 methyltransferase [Acerihabitans sp. TG2]
MNDVLNDNTPLRRDGFTFKRFFAAHDRCAMKVGTDAVLLGAWTPLADAVDVLDIGTGCGLIALMLAQRTGDHVRVAGIELDERAACQARENFALSPWRQRLKVIQGDILNPAVLGFPVLDKPGHERDGHAVAAYQLIVSNPPYFPVGVACGSTERDRARHTASLTHQRLLEVVRLLLAPQGLFSMVLPAEIGERVIGLAQGQGWHLRYRTDVADRPGKAPHRMLLALSLTPGAAVVTDMVLKDPDGRYSAAYRTLAGDFYLHMSGVATPAP